MRIFLIFFCYFLCQLNAYTQYVYLIDARLMAISGSIESTGENYTGQSNPAGLIGNTNTRIGMHYSNRFMLPELGVKGIVLAVPVWRGSFAGRINYFGSGELNQSMFVVSYGHVINSWLAAGIDLNYHLESIKAFHEVRSAISGNLGVIFQPMDELTIGMYYINLTHTAYKFETEDPGTSLHTGISYTEAENFLLIGMLSWVNYHWLDIALGSEIYLNQRLVIRGGIRLPSSMSYSFGTGIFFPSVDFNLGFEMHPVLGLSSSMSVIIKIKRNGKR